MSAGQCDLKLDNYKFEDDLFSLICLTQPIKYSFLGMGTPGGARAYSWLCPHGSLMVELGEPYVLP